MSGNSCKHGCDTTHTRYGRHAVLLRCSALPMGSGWQARLMVCAVQLRGVRPAAPLLACLSGLPPLPPGPCPSPPPPPQTRTLCPFGKWRCACAYRVPQAGPVPHLPGRLRRQRGRGDGHPCREVTGERLPDRPRHLQEHWPRPHLQVSHSCETRCAVCGRLLWLALRSGEGVATGTDWHGRNAGRAVHRGPLQWLTTRLLAAWRRRPIGGQRSAQQVPGIMPCPSWAKVNSSILVARLTH